MPTPFSHLKQSQCLLLDARLPANMRSLLERRRSAFQLGSIIADARVTGGIGRELTHFYQLGEPITEAPWRVMFRRYPLLAQAKGDAHLAFLAGYVAHLALDEYWAVNMVRPHFWEREWDVSHWRDKLFALHLILTVMDERDQAELQTWQADSLTQCQPQDWLPFLHDDILCDWRDFVSRQIAPGGTSQTLSIFSRRLGCDEAILRAVLDDPQQLLDRLWRHIPPRLLADVEARAYAYTRQQLIHYLHEFAGF
ncbi:MAG: hypothetical protein OXG92_00515 [Chloroflexi bacterium]|nr:hypothetical protein [Chloroflexota bacterium]MCY3583014.1 hypothetical protein [Chloroflexota bacterium]MCY3714937.1 hypothetical protein [Chloroflexota bacterium]MDE2651050.1 hypothetical protein [Chloroflexota bacterium]MXX50798.1 hypothetical protein [Chloroflexota bacterium]